MGILSGLQPEKVFEYFEAISMIPRGSGNMEAISDYVMNEGKRLGYEAFKDNNCNVVIKAPATPGYENVPVVMLQGHLDMVAEKDVDSDHDFMKDPLELFVDGDLIGAKGTTLGGDDGAAVVYMLAILADKELPHPALECVFTVDEEIGLVGANNMDFSFSNAGYLINLDSEDEGIFMVSCAGGMRWNGFFPVNRKHAIGRRYELTVQSSLGGHSGMEIQKDRPNSNIVMGQLLYDLKSFLSDFHLVSIDGGMMDNAIPNLTKAVIVSTNDLDISSFEKKYQNEYATTDVTLNILCDCTAEHTMEYAFTQESADNILFFLEQVPFGVQAYNHVLEGLVETSLNCGIIKTEEEKVQINFSIRSSVESKKMRLRNRLGDLCTRLGGTWLTKGVYPGWEYKKESKLRDLMVRIWNEKYEDTMGPVKLQALHAGLECGIISSAIPGIDIISMGPQMTDIHSPRERLSIASTRRCYEFLTEVLKQIRS